MSERVVVNIIAKPGVGKSTSAQYIADTLGMDLFRPSDVLRSFAATNGMPLRTRGDYVACNEILNALDPDAITRPNIESKRHTCIDGLRAIAHAQQLQSAVGMRTLALTCPDAVRLERIIHRGREGAKIMTLEEMLADERADRSLDPQLPNVDLVMAMHDLSEAPVDTNRPLAEVCAELHAIVAPLFEGSVLRQ